MSLLGLDVFVARWRLASAESVLAAQDRLELAQLEWKEQKRHWFKLMGLVLAVLALAVLSLVVFSMALMRRRVGSSLLPVPMHDISGIPRLCDSAARDSFA